MPFSSSPSAWAAYGASRRRTPRHATRKATAVSLAFFLWTGASMATDVPAFDLRLHPAVADEHGAIPFVDIAMRVEGIDVKKGGAIFSMPTIVATTKTNADQIIGLTIDDSRGSIPWSTQDSVQGLDDQTREWHASRDVSGAVNIHYRVMLEANKPLFTGPMLEMRTSDGSFSGAGMSFLVLPTDKTPRTIHVHWELPDGDPASKGASSLGLGDTTGVKPLAPGRMGYTFFMGGKLGEYRGKNGRFFGAWTGSPGFPVEDVMTWTESLHAFYVTYFASDTKRFGIFTRANPLNPGSGIGLADSFAFTYGPPTTVANTRILLAHEMVHTEMPSMEDGSDPDPLTTAWFEEGIAVHFEHVLPLRAGLIDRKAFLQDVNKVAAQYYTNSERSRTNAEAAAGFWLDSHLRLLPYNRGAMYFAQLDATIRRHSNGKRSLDDLIHAILARYRPGHPLNEAFWKQLVVTEAGQEGLAEYKAMLEGKLVLPPSDAFGPCFQRVVRKTPPFEMGFVMDSARPPSRITQMKHGSEAEKAGLREGDIVIKGRPGDGTLMDADATMTLKITRGDKTFDVTYLPRGTPVDTYQWEESHSPPCQLPTG